MILKPRDSLHKPGYLAVISKYNKGMISTINKAALFLVGLKNFFHSNLKSYRITGIKVLLPADMNYFAFK